MSGALRATGRQPAERLAQACDVKVPIAEARGARGRSEPRRESAQRTDAMMQETKNEGAIAKRLQSSWWEFGRPADTAPRPLLIFEPGGAIAGNVNRHLVQWRTRDGFVELLSAAGQVTSRFGEIELDENRRLKLKGLSLQETGEPAERVLIEAKSMAYDFGSRGAARRNLVVMRAGNACLFPEWTPTPTRSWDLAISFYGEGRPDWGQEYFHVAKGPKWEPIYLWLSANPQLLNQYDYIWFPDDDIMTTWKNVDDLFQVCRDYDLQLAQPALTDDSFRNFPVAFQDPNCLLRFTVWVEGMVPLFRADALRLCMPVMQEPSRYGWGHDWIWPMLLGYPPNKIAVIDRCAVKHTRPLGVNTDHQVANAEMSHIVRKFGARFMDQRVRGRISLSPEPGHFVP